MTTEATDFECSSAVKEAEKPDAEEQDRLATLQFRFVQGR